MCNRRAQNCVCSKRGSYVKLVCSGYVTEVQLNFELRGGVREVELQVFLFSANIVCSCFNSSIFVRSLYEVVLIAERDVGS